MGRTVEPDDDVLGDIEHWKPVAAALCSEYGWEPRIVGVGDPGGYEGWERIAKTALEAANHQGAVEALQRIADGDVDGVGDYSECVQLYAQQMVDKLKLRAAGGRR